MNNAKAMLLIGILLSRGNTPLLLDRTEDLVCLARLINNADIMSDRVVET